jgi:hydroxyacylglutathione hydrolase
MSATAQRPLPLHELAPGLALARGGPGRTLNVYLLGDVVVDAGVRWSRRRLARQLAGRRVAAHVLTHAHFDHAGCSAWLCRTLGVPLWCGAGDAAAISSGRVDTHGSQWVNRLERILAPVAAHPVSRTVEEGDLVGGFEVLEVPGHSPGALAFWRARDRALVCGDVLADFGCIPSGRGWCWRRRRCRRRTSRTGARLLGWPRCGPGWPVSGTALRSPTRAGSPTPSTDSCQRPRNDPRRPAPGKRTHARTPHRRQCRSAEQPAEPHPARPRTGVPGCVRAAGRR